MRCDSGSESLPCGKRKDLLDRLPYKYPAYFEYFHDVIYYLAWFLSQSCSIVVVVNERLDEQYSCCLLIHYHYNFD